MYLHRATISIKMKPFKAKNDSKEFFFDGLVVAFSAGEGSGCISNWHLFLE